ncbi:MAG: FecR family protein [Lentisphaeria bacterium]|nr:FecR family protein [Candidatus Neomarinimicrobiota bacterium]MCF7841699.1 FecR family protein [Lentisphaeria bacterium]
MLKKLLQVTLTLPLLLGMVRAEKLAVVTKAGGEVMVMKSDSVDWSANVTMGTSLEGSDKIKVGADGWAVLLLLDDKSQVKLRPNTELSLSLEEDILGQKFTVHLDYGKALSRYKGGADMAFQVQTPTSVASVKGTEFWTMSDPNGVDRVIVTEGFVDVENSVSGAITSAQAGETVTSTSTGGVLNSPTMEDETPEDPEDEFGQAMPEQEPGVGAPGDTTDAGEAAVSGPPSAGMPGAPGETPTTEGEGEEEGGGLFGDNLAMDAAFGAVTIDGQLYNQLALRPDISVGKLGVGLDLILYIDQDGNILSEQWTEPKNLIDKVLYVRWAQPGDPFFFRVGALDNVTMGYGLFMSGYSNMMEYPSIRKSGMHLGVTMGSIGVETMVANFKEITNTPEFGFGLAGLRGTYKLGKFTFGATAITDYNQYLGLKDVDGDGYPDYVDGTPDEAHPNDPRMNVDSDGDGIPDAVDPDRDGNGYTDNSQNTSVVDNDPDIATIDQRLKGDPFDIHKNARGIVATSVDAGYPILNMPWLNLTLFGEFGKYFGKDIQFYDRATSSFSDVEYGWGMAAPGFRANLFNFVNLGLEWRMTGGDFIYNLFGQNYDIERVTLVDSAGVKLIPVTRYEKLFNNDPLKGIFGSLGVNVLNIVTVSGAYQDMRQDGADPVKGIYGDIALSPDVIPKIKEARAYINRMNVSDPWDFKSEGTLMGYRVGANLAGGVTITWDFRQTYRDLNGNGVIDEDNETVKTTSIETGFSF